MTLIQGKAEILLCRGDGNGPPMVPYVWQSTESSMIPQPLSSYFLHSKGRLTKTLKLDEPGCKSLSKLHCCCLPRNTHPKGSRSSPPTANGLRGSRLKQTRTITTIPRAAKHLGSQELKADASGGTVNTRQGRTFLKTTTQGILQSGP